MYSYIISGTSPRSHQLFYISAFITHAYVPWHEVYMYCIVQVIYTLTKHCVYVCKLTMEELPSWSVDLPQSTASFSPPSSSCTAARRTWRLAWVWRRGELWHDASLVPALSPHSVRTAEAILPNSGGSTITWTHKTMVHVYQCIKVIQYQLLQYSMYTHASIQ